MKTLLLGSQIACIASLLFSGAWRRYRALSGLLAVGALATVLISWDGEGYSWIAGPVLVFRVLATLEVARRQTEHFRYWTWLTGGMFLLAVFYAGSVWTGPVETFQQFRRLVQIWCAAYLALVQVFWCCYRFWWRSIPNWVAGWFCLSLLNHGAVSLASSLRHWNWLDWWKMAGWSWGVEAGCWCAIALTFTLCRRGRDGLPFRFVARKFAPGRS